MSPFSRKIISVTIIGAIFLSLSGCVTINLGGTAVPTAVEPTQSPIIDPIITPTAASAVLTEATIMNAEYLSPMLQQPIQMVDGKFVGLVDGVELTARIQPAIQFGDLNADKVNDTAFLLAEDTGGTGVFVSLIVVYSQGDVYRQAQGVLIDDRPVVNSMVIEDGMVKVTGLIHGPNDPMVNPTTLFAAEYTLFGERVVKTRLTSAFNAGAEHAINIESPVDGQEVSGSFYLVGSMPIGPFENNLALLISDLLTGQLVHEGFMVSAEDMGAPAVFNNLIHVPQVPAGTEILVTLMEISMADGTPIAIDSVRVIVQ